MVSDTGAGRGTLFQPLSSALSGDRSLDLCGVNVVLEEGDRQSVYQAYNDAQLEGVGAVMVALRQLGIRDDAALRAMSADDQRNTLIVELDAQTKRGQALQVEQS